MQPIGVGQQNSTSLLNIANVPRLCQWSIT